MNRRPSFLYVWLPLALAAYCFATVLDAARKRDWREVPARELGLVDLTQEAVVGDRLGRLRSQWTTGPTVLGYRYSVDGRRYQGYWNGSALPVEPVTVLYDPDRPERSTLKARRTSPAVHAIGWAGLALGLAAFGLRRRLRSAPAPASPPQEAPAASGSARTAFRLLVLAELAILLIRKGLDAPAERLPPEVWDQVHQHLQPSSLQPMFTDIYPVALVLSVIASLGLLTFWRPARQLYVITWFWWLAATWFTGAWIDYELDAVLVQTSRLLAGAIVALSFYGPLGKAFEVRRGLEDETGRGLRRHPGAGGGRSQASTARARPGPRDGAG